MECIICENEIDGYGNNPYPVTEKGLCCDMCNTTIVIPERIKLMYNDESNS